MYTSNERTVTKEEINSCALLSRYYKAIAQALKLKCAIASDEVWLLEAASSHLLVKSDQAKQAAKNGGAKEIRFYIDYPESMDREMEEAFHHGVEPPDSIDLARAWQAA